MKVLFSKPPWWTGTATDSDGQRNCFPVYGAGARAGSRWPFTGYIAAPPDRFTFGAHPPYPFFMSDAATCAAHETGAEVAGTPTSTQTPEKYAGVRPDDGYLRELDGRVKF